MEPNTQASGGQLHRLAMMDRYLGESVSALDAMEQALARFAEVQEPLKALSYYYSSPEWIADFEDDEAGRLPAGTPRGALSEDGIDTVLGRNKQILMDMAALLGRVLGDSSVY